MTNTDCFEKVPTPQEIRERLAKNAQEKRLLQRLLKVAEACRKLSVSRTEAMCDDA
ncbi:MAG: hypothetical protein ACYC4U_02355 [Pirellulaceae bacterium]